jgi:tetratricopeptide (TPR) repeat protein
MKQLVSLIFGLLLSICSFAQRSIPEKTIKSIEARMVDLKSSTFLVDSLFQDYLKSGRFNIQDDSNPRMISTGSSLLFTYYTYLSNKYGKKCLGCKMRADSLNQQMIEENNLENDIAYRNVINAADKHFNQKNFPKALELYKRAVSFRSSDPYPKDRILEIDQILSNVAKEKQYKDYILAADNYFASKDYVNAKANYINARLIKVSETYPQEKILQIDGILKEKKK